MTEEKFSKEFLSHYLKRGYGRFSRTPDYSKCCKEVFRGGVFDSSQCARKNGHGPDGAYCKQHDPDAVREKLLERREKLDAEIEQRKIIRDLEEERMDVIRMIAGGHNDPRGLCADWLKRWEERKKK